MASYYLIATTTVGATSVSTIEFSSIPQTYTDLQLVYSLRSNDTTATTGNYDPIYYRLNGTTSGYTAKDLSSQNTSVYSGSSTTDTSAVAGGTWGRMTSAGAVSANATASCFSLTSLYIPNYTGSTSKSITYESVMEQNQAASWVEFGGLLWSNTAAITSIAIALKFGSFVQYSSASLYGIKNS